MRRIRKSGEQPGEVNVTPMLDIVFIMLIFFIVSASFVKEEGIAASNASDEIPPSSPLNQNIQMTVTEDCWVILDNRHVTPERVSAVVRGEAAARPGAPAVISIHGDARTDCVVGVMDQIRLGGITQISLHRQDLTL